MKPLNENILFQEVDGIWQRVDSQEPNPPTLAEYIEKLNILKDDNTQFCRIIRYYDKWKQTIVYRSYLNKVTIDIYYVHNYCN